MLGLIIFTHGALAMEWRALSWKPPRESFAFTQIQDKISLDLR
jgi:hypothetical protein